MNTEMLARQLADLEFRAAELAEALYDKKAQLLEALDVGDTIDLDGEPAYRVMSTRKFDETKARDLLPAHVIDQATEEKLSARLVRAMIPPVLYDAVTTEGTPYIKSVR